MSTVRHTVEIIVKIDGEQVHKAMPWVSASGAVAEATFNPLRAAIWALRHEADYLENPLHADPSMTIDAELA